MTRQSTNIFSVDDDQVARALRFIRERYKEPIQVKHVVAATVLSRRDLELKFKSKLRRSIKDEIDRLRIALPMLEGYHINLGFELQWT